MTEQHNAIVRLPESVVREDQQLEASVANASEALAHLRWHWTMNEDNSGRVSFKAYAREVRRSDRLIRKYAQGYEIFRSADGGVLPLSEAIERAMAGAEKQAIVDAVADANNVTYAHARRWHTNDVSEVKQAVGREQEKREQKGVPFPVEDREEYAKRVAEMKRRTREREERERIEQAKNHTAVFMSIDSRLSTARQEVKKAIQEIEEVEFSDEEVGLLEREYEAVQGLLRLFGKALTGDSGTDWDAELAELEERRQYG